MKRALFFILALSIMAALAMGELHDTTKDRTETLAAVGISDDGKLSLTSANNPVDSTFGPLHPPVLRMQFSDLVPNHNMGIGSDGMYYYTVCGGQSANGRLAKYDLNGTHIVDIPCPLDFRSIVYNNADGLFYVSVYTGDVYRITDVNSGAYLMLYDNLLQNVQSSMGISWDGQYIYDNHNGVVRKINLSTGIVETTMTGFSCGASASTGGDAVVVDPDYIYTYNTSSMTLYVYDHSGTQAQTYTISQGNYGFSLSFIIGDIWSAVDGNYGVGTWYAHNIREFIVSSLSITLTPMNPPVIIPAGGGNMLFDAVIHNHTNAAVNFDAWSEVELPNGAIYGPIIRRLGLTAPASATISRRISQFVPGAAPSGNYLMIGRVRTLPDSTVVSSSFPFTKLVDEGTPAHNQGWACYGWEEDDEAVSIHHSSFIIHPCIPNPFNPVTAISFQIQTTSFVKLAVYDITGRETATLAEGWYPAGRHTLLYDASSQPSGVYFARLDADGINQTVKLLLVK